MKKGMESKLSQFMIQTGASADTAKEILEGHNWDLEAAVRMYKFMQNATVPPAGPQKNIEPKMNPNAGGGIPMAGSASMRPLGQSGDPSKNANLGVDVSGVQHQMAPSSPSGSLTRKLKRGISKTSENVTLVNKVRDIVLHDINESTADHLPHFVETPDFTFVLPDLTIYSEDFRAFLHKDLIETSTLVSLEQAGRLNWWADMGVCQRLLPLATTGDGNCLLHAASLGMWGFHDRLLTLRKALFHSLTQYASNAKGAFWRRWRWHQTQVNKESGLVFSEQEWQDEWQNLLSLASTKPRCHHTESSSSSCCHSPATKGLMERTNEKSPEDSDVFYESLEEFHVFVLAHVLRRPIIVVADTILKDSNGEALAPIPFGGIYLPLESDPKLCHRSPLLLTYDASHFSALVAMEQQRSPDDRPGVPAAIPLVDPEFKLLPIHYMIDPGPNFAWGKDDDDPQKTHNLELAMEDKVNLIREYLDIERLLVPSEMCLPDSNGASDFRPRSGSHSGSVDSDENSVGSSGSSKDGKDKNRMSKQMQSVAKSFGSIGKNMGKKLKKNFGGVGKGMKEMEKEKPHKRTRKASVGSVTQSTKVTSAMIEMLKEGTHILSLRLSHKRPEYQEEMVKNYLHAAQERFKQDRELRRQQDKEIIQKTEQRRLSLCIEPTTCINPGCQNVGSASTSYLCPGCFEKEKQQALNYERTPPTTGPPHPAGPPPAYQPYPAQQGKPPAPLYPQGKPPVGPQAHAKGNVSPQEAPFVRQDTLVTSGKSKFYTLCSEEHSAPKKGEPGIELNNAKSANAQDRKEAMRIARSTFYAEPSHQTGPKGQGGSGSTRVSCPPLPAGAAVIVNDLSHASKGGGHPPAAGRLSPEYDNLADWSSGYSAEDNTQFVDPSRKATGRPVSVQPASARNSTAGYRLSSQPAFDMGDGLMAPSNRSSGAPTVQGLGMVTAKSQGGAPVNQKGSVNGMAPVKCANGNCPFYGTEATGYLCSSCYREKKGSDGPNTRLTSHR